MPNPVTMETIIYETNTTINILYIVTGIMYIVTGRVQSSSYMHPVFCKEEITLNLLQAATSWIYTRAA